jgi:SSS sodium solute transporter superfamily
LLLSASMSTLSALVLSASSSFSVDLVAKHIKTNKEKKTHALLRGMCVLFIALSLAVTIFHIPIVDLMSYSWGIIAGAFLGPYIWGLFYSKTTREGAWAGMILGAGSSLVMTALALAGVPGFAGHAPMIGVIGMLASLIAVPVVSLCTAKKGHFGNLTGIKEH